MKQSQNSDGLFFPTHPPYSPVLAPSDFHLFGALKDAISGKVFGSDDEVTEEVAATIKLKLV
jgi:hypothetical protein